jgi:putative transposase
VSASPVVVILSHRPTILSGMLVRYRYRIDPTRGQRQALARAFGCARVVYNDALRERERAHAAGEKVSDTQVQRRVITLAKSTPERAWLAEVASVALVQACQDARRADRNWFASLSGTGKGRRVGHPRFRTKRGRQSIRLTRNGLILHRGRLDVAKLGQVRVRWSRPLPSAPSSVTIIRDPDGRSSASFVVERAPTPLTPVDRVAGIDLGLAALATIAASDGTVETIANPGTCAPPSGGLPVRNGSSPARPRGRPTGSRPGIGSRSATARSTTGAPITTTSSPCGWSVRTKRWPWKT